MTFNRVVRCYDDEDLKETLEDMQGLGYKVEPWRSGYRVTKPHRGKTWIHVLLALMSWGWMNLIYWGICRSKRTVYYVRVARGVAPSFPL